LFMDCLSTKWTCMDDAAGSPHVSHSPSQAGAVPAADGCAARTAGTVFRLARRTAARLAGRSPAKAGTHAHGLFVTAKRAADGQRRAVADRTLVAQRQRALPALEAEADADPVLGTDARGAGRHVQHRRPHCALAVDTAVLVGEAPFELALVGREAVAPGVEALVGVGVRGRNRFGCSRLELGDVHRVGRLGAGGDVGDLALVA